VAEVESKLVDANKSRVFDGLLVCMTWPQSSAICRWIAAGISAPTRGR
jgi:hypothetical protein